MSGMNPAFIERVREKRRLAAEVTTTAEEEIIRIVANAYGCTLADIYHGPKRQSTTSKARHSAIKAVAHQFPDWSTRKLSGLFGVNQASVCEALRGRR